MSEKNLQNQTHKKEQDRTAVKKGSILRNYFKNAGNISELCKIVGIARATFYEWRKKDEGFDRDIKEQREALVDYVENKLFGLIEKNDKASIFFFLKCKAKDRGYIEQQQHKHEGEVNINYISHIPPTDKKKEGND